MFAENGCIPTAPRRTENHNVKSRKVTSKNHMSNLKLMLLEDGFESLEEVMEQVKGYGERAHRAEDGCYVPLGQYVCDHGCSVVGVN